MTDRWSRVKAGKTQLRCAIQARLIVADHESFSPAVNLNGWSTYGVGFELTLMGEPVNRCRESRAEAGRDTCTVVRLASVAASLTATRRRAGEV